jgi:hypothetical protein
MTRMRIITRFLTAAALLAATACSSTVRTGDSPVFLVIATLTGIRGANTPSAPSSFLISDVITGVTTGPGCTPQAPCMRVFGDSGQVTLQLAAKNVTLTAPTTNNQVTITRIHVHYRLADTTIAPVQGVNVPNDFDTFVTGTVPATGNLTLGFELVRVQAKESTPLVQLNNGGQINGTADVTFFGTDQVGNAISVTGSIAIQFGDWADPA